MLGTFLCHLFTRRAQRNLACHYYSHSVTFNFPFSFYHLLCAICCNECNVAIKTGEGLNEGKVALTSDSLPDGVLHVHIVR